MWRLCSQHTCGKVSHKVAIITTAPFAPTLLSSCSLPFSLIAALRACGSTLTGSTNKNAPNTTNTKDEVKLSSLEPTPSTSTKSSIDMQTYGGPLGRFKEAEKAAQAQEDGAIPFVSPSSSSSSSSSSRTKDCLCGHTSRNTSRNTASQNQGSRKNANKVTDDDSNNTNANEPERHFRPRTTFGDFGNVELQPDNIDEVMAAVAAASHSTSPSSSSSLPSTSSRANLQDKVGSGSSGINTSSSSHSSKSSNYIKGDNYTHSKLESSNNVLTNADFHHDLTSQHERNGEDDKTHFALEEIERFLAQNTLRSIERSRARENAEAQSGYPRLPPGHRGVQTLLDYNKQWAHEMTKLNPGYFKELAKEQKPEYLWIGCSDSRVPANEVVGLHPGDVFVHRNIGNIFSLSDLNCLSALQFAVDCLKVQHVIIAGHYKCGGVTAAMRGDNLGLTDHWIMQVTDIKNKWWDRVTSEIPVSEHLSVLCELNVLEQLSHLVNCRILQRRWRQQNDSDGYDASNTPHVFVRQQYAKTHHLHYAPGTRHAPQLPSALAPQQELEVHGWVYSLDDGMLRPLLTLTRFCNLKKKIATALDAVFIRYSQTH